MPSSNSHTTPNSPSTLQPILHSYHCLCSTYLLTTPYDVSTLPQRRHPSLNLARILPFPSLPSSTDAIEDASDELEDQGTVLPSLLSPNLKAARRPLVVQLDDGWEKRRVWRCGRCGLCVGYEVIGERERAEGLGARREEGLRVDKVLFLLDGALVEMGKWEG